MTTRVDPLAVEEGLLAKAADEAVARGQEMSMILTGEPLEPRLEVGLAGLAPVRATGKAARLAEPIAPTGRQGGLWPGGRADSGSSSEARYPPRSLLVPLLVFAGLLATVLVTHGDGTRGVLALGVVVVAVLIILVPVLSRRQAPSLPREEVKDVLDVMAGVILATHPRRDAPADGEAEATR